MKRLISTLIPFAAAALSACAAPFVAVDFTQVEDGVASSARGDFQIHMEDGAKVLPGGPTGTPYAEFDGTAAPRVDARQVERKLAGDEMAASLWFRADALADCPIAFGFSTKAETRWSEAPFGFSLPTKENDFGTYSLWARMEGNTSDATGVWHHVAFRYSVSNDSFTVWLDGFPQRDVPIGADEPAPVDKFFARPFAKGFRGALADLRVWNVAPATSEILAMNVPQSARKETADAFGKAAATPGTTPSFKKWCEAMAAKASSFGDSGNVRDWMVIQEARWKLPELARLATGVKAQSLVDAPLLPISIYPYHWLKRLPFRMPEDGKACNCLEIRAALGEIEGASFMAFPFESGKLFAEPSALAGPGGAKLPASVLDVRTVKFWHSHASGWNSYFGGGKDFPVLTGECLLHDDALLRVDREKHRNYLRISDPDGDRYVDISVGGTPENMEHLKTDVEPVLDAKTFQPMPVAAGDLFQLWITARIPADATPGDYSGSLALTLDGKPAGTLPVTLRVYPFKLPKASPRYNIDETYFGSVYHHISLPDKLGKLSQYGVGEANSLSNACRKLLAEFKNLAEHNVFEPFTISYGEDDGRDLSDIQIDLMRQAGLDTKVMKGNLSGCDSHWCFFMNLNREKYNFDISVEANEGLFHERMAAFSNQVAQTTKILRERQGEDTALYCYGVDEAGPGTVRREMPFFATLQHYGHRSYTSMSVAEWCAFMTDYNNIPAHIGRTANRSWHEGGCKVGTYAAPFFGPENPELWRRSMGIRLYMSNFDGFSNYCWYEAFNPWNNFVKYSKYGNFCIVYPTIDGVVDTVGWEGVREAFDDIRYLTLLRRLARAAMRSDRRDVKRLGRRAYAWAELVDPESVELDDMRVDAVKHILALREALKDVDTEKLYE